MGLNRWRGGGGAQTDSRVKETERGAGVEKERRRKCEGKRERRGGGGRGGGEPMRKGWVLTRWVEDKRFKE